MPLRGGGHLGCICTEEMETQTGKFRHRDAHPWFGPMDASAWHALAGTHMGIHRAQIADIIAGLER